MSAEPFLRAQWRNLAMLNYEVEPSALAGLVPPGTELDQWRGHTYLSVVGFLFLGTRVRGLPVPSHRDFGEVKSPLLRPAEDRRGLAPRVVFVKEIVPRAAIAIVARALYNENSIAVPMHHEFRRTADESKRIESVSYGWRVAGRQNRRFLAVGSDPRPLVSGSHEEFIAEHHCAYSVRRDGATCEYEVTHAPWRVAPATHAELDCDVGRIYGDALGRFLGGSAVSAFLADGSEVAVSHGVRLAG